MSTEARRPRSVATLLVLLACAALAGAGFAALGVWQVHRLAWKEALIARVDRHLHAAPVPAPPPARWSSIGPDDEYLRIVAQGRFDYAREVFVRASTILGPGYWVLTPLRTDDGWLLVNRGFVPPEMRLHAPHGDAVQTVTGLLRASETGGLLLQHNAPAQQRWYSRDVGAIAAAEGLDGPVAPYFLDEQANPQTATATWPRPGLTVIQFRNEHLQYALTWFALAAMTAAAIGYLLVDERKLRRAAGAPSRVDRNPP